ncbi:hypothetical protein DSO57_1016359 [Entomophthora muscae]|uniref:Uncharacterized protein n=1 Tax=Entomophthora muscae TaxID=34485 RepID=A0ACC2UQH5_9FUNG|nr:hypothetical protein DSO57_1016359 [Entomophthora muscae]
MEEDKSEYGTKEIFLGERFTVGKEEEASADLEMTTGGTIIKGNNNKKQENNPDMAFKNL